MSSHFYDKQFSISHVWKLFKICVKFSEMKNVIFFSDTVHRPNTKVTYVIHHTETCVHCFSARHFYLQTLEKEYAIQDLWGRLPEQIGNTKTFCLSSFLPLFLWLVWLLGDCVLFHSDKHKMPTTVPFVCNCATV